MTHPLTSYPPVVYDGQGGEVSAWIRPQDAVPELVYPNGVRVHYLAQGSATNGEFGLYRWEFSAARSGPDPHFHRTITESFYILSGSIAIFDGRAWRDTQPGDFAVVPQGGIHGFRNESGEPGSMLLLFTPGAPREEYFETLATLAEHPMTPPERAAFMDRHDNHWVEG